MGSARGLGTDPDDTGSVMPSAMSSVQQMAKQIIIDSVSTGIKKGVDDVWNEYKGPIIATVGFFGVCALVTTVSSLVAATK